jgi:heme exporter protein A
MVEARVGGEVLAAQDLVRTFGRVRALAGVSFSLGEGESLAVFGPNGAGKTTLLRVLAGLLKPDRGRVALMGRVLESGDPSPRRQVGLISHQSFLYDGLSALENLTFFAGLYDLAGAKERAMEGLRRVGLEARAHSLAGTMSRGMVQRLAIARALLHDPAVVLLDEPFTGLDQRAAGSLRDELRRLAAERRTVVLVTHNLDEGLELATHVAIMTNGGFVEQGARDGDAALYRSRYQAAVAGNPAPASGQEPTAGKDG